MNEKFTPPVWKIKSGMIVEAGNEKGIAILFGRPEIENNANRLLIAAAPEMYFMLYNLLFELKRGNASNTEYVAQAVPQIEDLLRRINHEQRRPIMTPELTYMPKAKVLEKDKNIYLVLQENENSQEIKIPLRKYTKIESATFQMYDLLSELRSAYYSNPDSIEQIIPQIDKLWDWIHSENQEGASS